MERTRIKICGISTVESALVAAECGADAIGFMFYESSPRWVAPGAAAEIMAHLPPLVMTVGVSVNLTVDEFCELEQQCPTHLSQLHGQESTQIVAACGPGVIRAIQFHADTIEEELARWGSMPEVDALLIDGSAGGQGESFDWESLKPHMAALNKPVLLAGGLRPDNVAEAVRILRPFAVDVSSGVESAPGQKDAGLIREFCQAVRAADRA